MHWKSVSLSAVGLALSFTSVVFGDKIQDCKTTEQMLWTTALAVALLAAAIVVVAIASLVAQSEQEQTKSRKIKRVPTHNNAWRGDC